VTLVFDARAEVRVGTPDSEELSSRNPRRQAYFSAMRHPWLCAVVFTTATFAANPPITIRDLDVPFFDSATGKPTRRLMAPLASGSLDEPKLSHATVLFFPRTGEVTTPVGKMEVEDATWRQRANEITGEGAIRLTSPRGTVFGRGYRYNLETNRLQILNAFRGEFSEGVIEAKTANLLLASAATDDEAVILSFEARGVVATFTGAWKQKAERAETETATYTAEGEMLHLVPPVRTWLKGKMLETNASNIISIPVGKEARSTLKKP
jgi:hypothetical protein